MGGVELLRKVIVSADRALHDGGEKGDEQGVLAQVGRRLGFAAVHVDDVGGGAEGVEGDTQGQDEGGDGQSALGEQSQHVIDGSDRKARVLQHRQNTEVEDKPPDQHTEALLLPLCLVGLTGILVHVGLMGGYVVLVGLGAALHDPRQEEGGEDGGEDEGQIPAPRRGVEQGACGEQYHPLRPLGQEVVQKHRHRRKYEEG